MSEDVTALHRSQKRLAARVLASALLADPLYLDLFPDVGRRERALQSMFSGVLAYARRYGVNHTTSDVAGVAIWLGPGNARLTLWRMLRTGMALPRALMGFDRAARARFLRVMNGLDAEHRDRMPGPHWYLWALGVHPERQRRGIGERLLQPVLALADRQGLPCYLEASTERSAAFYQKSGFETRATPSVLDGRIPMWLMSREPG